MSRQPKLFKTPVPPELQPAVDYWLAYKRARHDKPYTDVGFQGLVQRMAEWGPERSMANAVYSASQNWAGLYEEPAKRNGERQSWDEQKEARIVRELRAPGIRAEAPIFDIQARLAALFEALPMADAYNGVALRLSRLAEEPGVEPGEIEAGLSVLDAEMLEAARLNLDGEEAEISKGVEKTLALLRGRLPAGELQQHRERLFWQVLRRRLSLPTLSLFSPEAEP